MKNIAILIFEDMEELDGIGPYEVFSLAGDLQPGTSNTYTVAETNSLIRCAHGLKLKPEYTLADAPLPDIVVIPGGRGSKTQETNPAILNWVQECAKRADLVTSVCTGLRITLRAGIASGKRVTTHHAAIEDIRENYDAGEVIENMRFVKDGNYISATGISAGIDMALWVVGQITSAQHARTVQQHLQYNPAPPYQYET